MKSNAINKIITYLNGGSETLESAETLLKVIESIVSNNKKMKGIKPSNKIKLRGSKEMISYNIIGELGRVSFSKITGVDITDEELTVMIDIKNRSESLKFYISNYSRPYVIKLK